MTKTRYQRLLESQRRYVILVSELREHCAKIALGGRVSGETGSGEDEAYNRACEDIAASIRKSGETVG